MLKLDLSQLAGFLPQGYAVSRQTGLKKAADMLAAGNGPGGGFHRLGGPAGAVRPGGVRPHPGGGGAHQKAVPGPGGGGHRRLLPGCPGGHRAAVLPQL